MAILEEMKMDVNLTGPIADQIAANLIQPWYSLIINLMVAVGTLALAYVTRQTLTEMRKEKYLRERKQQKELLGHFKQELISNYRNSEYNRLHAQIEPDLPMNKLKSAAL